MAVQLIDELPRGRQGDPRAAPRVHGRRVPGREPGAAGAPRTLARRPRRGLRRRRRLPDDLRLHGRVAAVPAGVRLPLPRARTSWRSRRTTAARRRCSRSRTPSRRRSAASRRSSAPPATTAPTPRRGHVTTLRARSRSWSTRSGGSSARACRWRRSRCCTGSTRARSRTRRRSPRRAPVPGPRRLVPAPPRTARGARAAPDVQHGARSPRRWTRVTDALGYDPDADADADEEVTRQADLARMRAMAREYEARTPTRRPRVSSRSSPHGSRAERTGRGVQLLTYHRAKGLEFEAVFLPRLLGGELPFKRAPRERRHPDEERRLLYVGITRARKCLYLSWPREAKASPSPFLHEIGVAAPEASGRAGAARPQRGVLARRRVRFRPARDWRKKRAIADGVPAYVVFHDTTLDRDRRGAAQGLGRPRGDQRRGREEARPLRRRRARDHRARLGSPLSTTAA